MRSRWTIGAAFVTLFNVPSHAATEATDNPAVYVGWLVIVAVLIGGWLYVRMFRGQDGEGKRRLIWLIVAAIVGISVLSGLLSAETRPAMQAPLLLLLLGGGGFVGYRVISRNGGGGPGDSVMKTLHDRSVVLRVTRRIDGIRGQTGILIDDRSSRFAVYSGRLVKVYGFGDLIRSEIAQDGASITSTIRASQAIGAIAGHILAGPFGFIVGGLSGKSRSKSAVEKVAVALTVNDVDHPFWSIEFLSSKKPLARASRDAVRAISRANELHALLAVVIRKADEQQRSPAKEPAERLLPDAPVSGPDAPRAQPSRAGFAEEFMKLAALKQKGVLSETEFVQMKAALIEQAKRP